LGNASAHYDAFTVYLEGKHVKEDEKRLLYHLEEAAIGGHPMRYPMRDSILRVMRRGEGGMMEQ